MVEAARALLIQAKLPDCLWPFALKHVGFVRNRVPHATIGNTPYSIVTGAKPDLKHMRVFGCMAYVLRLPRGTKFEPRALERVYLETLEHGVYRILEIAEDGVPRLMESRHVTFDESMFPGAPALSDYSKNEVWTGRDFSREGEMSDDFSDSDDSDDEIEISLDGNGEDDSGTGGQYQESPAPTDVAPDVAPDPGLEEAFETNDPSHTLTK